MMDPEEEQAYMQQMQMQQQQEIYHDEYGNEVLMNQMGQQPYMEQTDASNALVRINLFYEHQITLSSISEDLNFSKTLAI